MAEFEYKVVPAPKRGVKAKGVKSVEDQFAHALTQMMNAAAVDGWEFQRTDTLPCEERHGLRGSTTTFQTMLVFRRMSAEAAASRLRAAVDDAEAQRATIAAFQTAAAPASPPQPQMHHVDAPLAVKAIEGPKPAPLAAESRVQETLTAGALAPAPNGPKILTPELRADAEQRMAAE